MTNEPTNAQLADWIEAGLATANVEESGGYYLARGVYASEEICKACALGLAVIGKFGSIQAAIEARRAFDVEDREASDQLGMALGISRKRANAVEKPHLNGVKAAEIAAMLRRGEIGE